MRFAWIQSESSAMYFAISYSIPSKTWVLKISSLLSWMVLYISAITGSEIPESLTVLTEPSMNLSSAPFMPSSTQRVSSCA